MSQEIPLRRGVPEPQTPLQESGVRPSVPAGERSALLDLRRIDNKINPRPEPKPAPARDSVPSLDELREMMTPSPETPMEELPQADIAAAEHEDAFSTGTPVEFTPEAIKTSAELRAQAEKDEAAAVIKDLNRQLEEGV